MVHNDAWRQNDFLCVEVWSKWLVSRWDVLYKANVMMVFMILKLEGKPQMGAQSLRGLECMELRVQEPQSLCLCNHTIVPTMNPIGNVCQDEASLNASNECLELKGIRACRAQSSGGLEPKELRAQEAQSLCLCNHITVSIMNPAKNVCEEEASLNAILVRSDGKRVSKPISELVTTVRSGGNNRFKIILTEENALHNQSHLSSIGTRGSRATTVRI